MASIRSQPSSDQHRELVWKEYPAEVKYVPALGEAFEQEVVSWGE